MNTLPAFNGPGFNYSQQMMPQNNGSTVQGVPPFNTQIPQYHQIQTHPQPILYGHTQQPQYTVSQPSPPQQASHSQNYCRMSSTSEEEFAGFDEYEQNNSSNKNSWQVVKNTKRRKISATNRPQETVTNNKFSPLTQEEIVDATKINENENKTPKPPPIYVYGVINYGEMIGQLGTIAESTQYTTKSLADNTVKICCDTPDTYRKVIKHMRDNDVIHHTYQPKEERAYRIVIKQLHHTTDIEEIKSELTKNGHKVRNVMNCKSRITKEPLNIFFVDLEPADNNRDIYKLSNLQNRAIQIEPPKTTKGITQCMRCQQYGHSRSYCNRPFACVKCGGAHNTTACKKSKDTPARCALCDGAHPANYKGCAFYHSLFKPNNDNNRMNIQKNANNTTTRPILHTTKPVPQNHYPIHPQNSYANVVRNDSEQQTNFNINDIMNKFLEEFKNMFQQLLQQNSMVLNMLSTLVSKIQ